MTESVSGVYDLTFPSPITLQEISSIVIVVELWREEIRAHVASKRLHELRLKTNIALTTVLPRLPSTIYNLLEQYVGKFRKSIFSWQNYHYRNVFKHDGWMNILNRFDDFAWDWDGTIHEERTAKRMMLCDRLTQVEKFKIACMYCFEDDIKQIWPSVSETKDLNEIFFHTCPEQYYWICYLRNELHKIPISYNESIDERMVIGPSDIVFIHGNRRNLYSVMYFWNRLPRDSQVLNHVNANRRWRKLFSRYILPKLSEHQLDIFVASKGVTLMIFMLKSEQELVHVLPTWKYIRSRMDITNFSNLINKLLREEAFLGEYFHSNVATLFSEIWNSPPQHFKRSLIDIVLYHNDELFSFRNEFPWERGITLLITILQDATFEERNVFWHENWPKLIFSAPVEDLVVMMKLSFRNENEITLFKENIMSMYENLAEGCTLMLKHGLFTELSQFLSFCCLNEQKRIELKRRLLRTNYIGDNSVFKYGIVSKNKLLKEFIDDAFQGAADLAVEFRNQLTSSPVTQNCLHECIRWGGDFVHLMEFVDTFFPDEQVRVPLKVRLFEHFRERLIAGTIQYTNGDKLEAVLCWFLGSKDEVDRFKQSISVEDIFRTMMRTAGRREAQVDGIDYKPVLPRKVDDFLMWYFNKDVDETEKFTKLFVAEFGSFFFTKRRETT